MHKDVTKSIGYIIVSKVVSFVIGIVRGFFVPGYLGPELYGIVGLLKLVKVILSFFAFGMDQAYLRLGIDMARKGENKDRLGVLKDNVFAFLLTSGITGLVATMSMPFIFRNSDPSVQRIMIFCFGITALQHLFNSIGIYYQQTLQMEKRFRFISFINMVQPLVAFVLIVATVFKWGINAVFVADLVAVIAAQLIFFRKEGLPSRIKVHWAELKKTLVYAFPFFISAVAFYLFRFSDRTVIASYLTLKDMGIYSFAVGIVEYTKILSVSINEVYTPYVIEEISHEGDLFKMGEKIKAYSYKLMFVTSAVAFGCIFFVPFVKIVLPKYASSVFILDLLLIATALRTFPLYQILILGAPSVKKQHYINWAMAVFGLLSFGLSVLLVKKGYGIDGVVIGTLIAHAAMAVFYVLSSERYYLRKKDPRFYAKMSFPVVLLCVMCIVQKVDPTISVRNFVFNTVCAAVFAAAALLVYRKEASDVVAKVVQGVRSLYSAA